MTTFLRLPLRESAITFQVVRMSDSVEVTRWASLPSAASASPMAKLVPMTGPASSIGSPRVPAKASRRPSVPWLKTMTALAPASKALAALS